MLLLIQNLTEQSEPDASTNTTYAGPEQFERLSREASKPLIDFNVIGKVEMNKIKDPTTVQIIRNVPNHKLLNR
jgi:hypothetical protein